MRRITSANDAVMSSRSSSLIGLISVSVAVVVLLAATLPLSGQAAQPPFTDLQRIAVLTAEVTRLRQENERLTVALALSEYRLRAATGENARESDAALDGLRKAFGCAPGAAVDQTVVGALFNGHATEKPTCVPPAAPQKPPEGP